MHSYIYQIGLKPFSEERLLTSDKIEVGDMSLFDYTYDIDEKSRAINIRILVDTILPAGMFVTDTDNNLIYQGGFKVWRKSYYDNVKSCSKALTPANIMGSGNALRNFNKAFHNPLNSVRLFKCGAGSPEQSIAFMRMVEGLKKGDVLYVGSVLGYHN